MIYVQFSVKIAKGNIFASNKEQFCACLVKIPKIHSILQDFNKAVDFPVLLFWEIFQWVLLFMLFILRYLTSSFQLNYL